MVPEPVSPGRGAQLQQLLVRGLARRNRTVVTVEVGRRVRRREARGTAAHRVADDLGHRTDLGVGRGRARSWLRPSPIAARWNADVAREIDTEIALAGFHVFGERLEVPLDRAHRGRMHLFDLGEQRGDEVAVAGAVGAMEKPQLPASTVVTP